MHPKLAWVESFLELLKRTMMDNIEVSVADDIDPLKKLIVLDFSSQIGKTNYKPIKTLATAFADVNDVVLEKLLRVGNKRIVLVILTKTRLGETSDKNPLR